MGAISSRCYGRYAYLYQNDSLNTQNDNVSVSLLDQKYHLDVARWLVSRKLKLIGLILLQIIVIIGFSYGISNDKKSFDRADLNDKYKTYAKRFIIIESFMVVADGVQLALYCASLWFWNNARNTLRISNANLVYILLGKMAFMFVPYIYVVGGLYAAYFYIYLLPYYFANITIFRIIKNALYGFFKSKIIDITIVKKLYAVSLIIYIPILITFIGLLFGITLYGGLIAAFIFEMIYMTSTMFNYGYYGTSKLKRVIEFCAEAIFYIVILVFGAHIANVFSLEFDYTNFILTRLIIAIFRVVHVKFLIGDFITSQFCREGILTQTGNEIRDEMRDEMYNVELNPV